ncbi:putative 15-hydroxyprostaglandin dehydrogenase [Viridothelium virens]|uniref:Putative 15-hydroxyprostaglandin dehydrogenase n=1 Tax=Viridothelium virens TaxID=1048519 RepID=A0A6A6HCV8_VIRVR|nr:putative 15-hydroxyprostaglandin dehydrogenase [Viridothelium virens]
MGVGNFPVRGQIAVVTGGGSGIGLEIAKAIVANGGKALVADLKPTKPAEQFIEASAGKAVFLQTNVTKREQLERIIPAAKKHFGTIPSIYVPAAGILEPNRSNWWADNGESSYATLDINVTHPLQLGRIALRALLRNNIKGVVVHVASLAGLYGRYAHPLYCASKHALVGFVKSMASADPQEGIKFVAVCPGIVKSAIWDDSEDIAKAFNYSELEAIEPHAVAEVVIELIENGDHVGGTCISMDEKGRRQVIDFPQSPVRDSDNPFPVYDFIKKITTKERESKI